MKRLYTPLILGVCSFLGGLTAVALGPRLVAVAGAQSAGIAVPGPADPGRAELVRLGERFEYVARKVGPAVVSVDSTHVTPRGGKTKTVEESGSGVLVRF